MPRDQIGTEEALANTVNAADIEALTGRYDEADRIEEAVEEQRGQWRRANLNA